MGSIFESIKNRFISTNPNKDLDQLYDKSKKENTTEFGGDDILDVDTINGSSYSQIFSMGLTGDISPGDLIKSYRNLTKIPLVNEAIEFITNAVVVEDDINSDRKIVEINITKEKYNDQIKQKIIEEYHKLYDMLEFDYNGLALVKQWYIDGKLLIQKIVDPDHPESGYKKLKTISPLDIRRIWDKKKKTFYWAYEEDKLSENQYIYSEGNSDERLIIADDLVYRLSSGLFDFDKKTSLSYLHTAIRDVNRLSTLEDHYVIYTIVRAPERRVFYIDPGNIPAKKANEILKNFKNSYMQSKYYNEKNGTVESRSKHPAMLEDFFLLRRGDKGTSIETLPGGDKSLNDMDQLNYFLKRAVKALNIPFSAVDDENSESTGKYSVDSEITVKELRFNRFVKSLRKKFNNLFYNLLKDQLVLKKIIAEDDWATMKRTINFDWAEDSYYVEKARLENLEKKLSVLQSAEDFIGKYITRDEVHRIIMNRNSHEIEDFENKLLEEKNKYADEED